ncbi:MAG: hypothetical protein K9W43_12380 [Candidatus Thorarchaeota archaeon]|nr:hypothetical protein [Candidatus Thorarchaeota archaeon]
MATREKNRSFKATVMLTFLLITGGTIVLTSLVSLTFGNSIGGMTANVSTQSLKQQATDNALSIANTTADIIKEKLTTAEGMILSLGEEVENLFSSKNTFSHREVYYDYFFKNTAAGPHPADVHFDPKYNINVSWNYSSWYIPGSTSSNYLTYESQYKDRLGRISNLDFMFKSVHERVPEFRWLYFTFADTDMFINYPGSILAGSDADRVSDPWHPTLDDWYLEIVAGAGKTVFVAPYFDPIESVLMISIGKNVYYENGTLMGVISGDISIDSINQRIINTQVYETGYAALIQGDGTVVAHPKVPASAYETETPTLLSVEGGTLTQSQVNEITSGNTGSVEYTRDGKDYLLVYAPVGKGDYTCIIIVPLEEVLTAIPLLTARINTTLAQTIRSIFIFSVIGLIVASVIGWRIIVDITKPLDQIWRKIRVILAQKFTGRTEFQPIDLKIDQEIMDRGDEFGDLGRALQGVMDTLGQEGEEK